MWKVAVLAVAVCVATCHADPVPIVFWHGMGDTCCNPLSLGRLINQVKKSVPGIYVQSIQIGKNMEEDALNGFFKNANDQIDMVCKNLTADTNLANGFNVIGFSQGGQFWRAVVQRCATVKVRNLISVGGQHQGVYGFPRCPANNSFICNEFRRLLNIGAYDSMVQQKLVQAEYWHDPFNMAEYRKDCVFLPDINQENNFNQDYKDRLSNISNLVLVKFEKDTMVQPKESEWFGFYKDNQTKDLYTLYESDIWTKDLLGLQYLNSTGRIHFLSSPTDHLRFTEEWFNQNLMPFINVDFAHAHLPVKFPPL